MLQTSNVPSLMRLWTAKCSCTHWANEWTTDLTWSSVGLSLADCVSILDDSDWQELVCRSSAGSLTRHWAVIFKYKCKLLMWLSMDECLTSATNVRNLLNWNTFFNCELLLLFVDRKRFKGGLSWNRRNKRSNANPSSSYRRRGEPK